jgi:hypothetical protein
VTAIRAEFINNRNFALVATGVAMANVARGVDFALMSKLLILFGELVAHKDSNLGPAD